MFPLFGSSARISRNVNPTTSEAPTLNINQVYVTNTFEPITINLARQAREKKRRAYILQVLPTNHENILSDSRARSSIPEAVWDAGRISCCAKFRYPKRIPSKMQTTYENSSPLAQDTVGISEHKRRAGSGDLAELSFIECQILWYRHNAKSQLEYIVKPSCGCGKYIQRKPCQ